MKNIVDENVVKELEKLGWKLTGKEKRVYEERGHYFIRDEYDGIVGTLWEINPKTGSYRHTGVTRGCFWTDWEGGDE